MPGELRLLTAFALATAAAYVLTPLSIRVANRTGFLDLPVGYKAHARPTPYLGGSAVMVAFLLVWAAFGGINAEVLPIVVGAIALWILGTVDDRVAVRPLYRVLAELAAGLMLWDAGLGWALTGHAVPDLLLTLTWVVGLVNAFNLLDNMDGTATTITGVCAGGAAVMAGLGGDWLLAVGCASLAGACAGFLPHNLATPARSFLGDGGSMPLGFLLAAAIMAQPTLQHGGAASLAAAVFLVAVPVLDTTLVVVSRRRRGVPLVTGGRDHLTHRLKTRLYSPARVALALGVAQAVLCAVGAALADHERPIVFGVFAAFVLMAAAVVCVLERPSWYGARSQPAG